MVEGDRLTDEMRTKIVEYCVSKLPEEACGAIIEQKKQTPDNFQLEQWFRPIHNTAVDKLISFVFDPVEWISLLYEMEQNDQTIVGIVHSHPTSSAVPSQEDLQSLWYTIRSHWIVSLQNVHQPIIKGYHYDASIHINSVT